MALTLEGNGFVYTLPETVDLREISQKTSLALQRVTGRRGAFAAPKRDVGGAQELLLSGLLRTGVGEDPQIVLNRLTQVLYSGELLLTDDELSRATRVRLRSFTYERVGGSFGQTLRIAARFAAPDGVSQSVGMTRQTGSITPLTAGAVVRNVVFAYAGTAPVGPVVNARLNAGVVWTPTITWKGSNLLANPSFEKGDGFPSDWAHVAGTRQTIYGSARSGDRFIRVDAGDAWRQDAPINGGATHTLSGYLRTPSSGTAKATVEWRDNALSLVNATTADVPATGAWTRFTLTGASSSTTAVSARVILEAASGTVEYDDLQLEQASSASAFSDAEHIAFTRDEALSEAGFDRTWSVEMDAGRVRLETGVPRTWQADLAHVNGRFFEMAPSESGLQHLTFSAPMGGNVDVETLYRERFL